jgi:hypothetical protein
VSKYPEHEKLKALGGKSQMLGEFLSEWLPERGIVLAEYHKHSPHCYEADDADQEDPICHWSESRLYETMTPVKKLLAEFFEIDEAKLEAEKEQMLDELRAEHQARKSG